jgi:hypothetical protein
MAALAVAATLAPGSVDARVLSIEGPVGPHAFGGALAVFNQLALVTALLILREEVDLDTLTAEVLGVAEQTMQPTRASLWLRPPPGSGVV